jgi:branched-chain amino acid transport system permease protein
MMDVLHFAPASSYMLGANFSYVLLTLTVQLLRSLLIYPLLLFFFGALVERFLLRRMHSRWHIHELLLIFGLAYILGELSPVCQQRPVSIREFNLFGVTYTEI